MGDFQRWLRETLHQRDLTQLEFANRTKVSHVAVQKWLKAQSTPSHRSIAKIAAVLEVPPSEVYGHLGQVPPLKGWPPDVLLILEQVLQLPPEIRDEVLAYVTMQGERERKRARRPDLED